MTKPVILHRRRLLYALSALGMGAIQPACGKPYAALPWKERLFVMAPWFYQANMTIPQQADLLRKLGYPAVSCSLNDETRNNFTPLLAQWDREKIDMVAVYSAVPIESDTIPGWLMKIMEALRGRDTLLWLPLISRTWKSSDQGGDHHAVALLRLIADEAQQRGLTISLYPHVNNWCERVEDTVRLVKKVQRKNVKCTFNLYHWLNVEGPNHLVKTAQEAMPYLNCLTINGSWLWAREYPITEGILPLGQGNFDVQHFLTVFDRLGYRGPVGIQGYGITGNIPRLLENSIDAWLLYCARL